MVRMPSILCKKEWDVCLGDSSCYLSWIGNIFGTSLEKKEVVRKGRLNGKLRSGLVLRLEVQKMLGDEYHILEEYDTYTNVIIYSNNGTLALLRSNGFYGDIIVGADNDAQIDMLGECLKEVNWK